MWYILHSLYQCLLQFSTENLFAKFIVLRNCNSMLKSWHVMHLNNYYCWFLEQLNSGTHEHPLQSFFLQKYFTIVFITCSSSMT